MKKGFTTPFFQTFSPDASHSLPFFVRLGAPCFRKSTALFLFTAFLRARPEERPPHRVRDRANYNSRNGRDTAFCSLTT